jgi:hypothetical protein
MPLITLDELKRKLSWENIVEDREQAPRSSSDNETIYYKIFGIRPEQNALPAICLFFADDLSWFGPLCFGPWHWDPYSEDPESNKIREAIKLAKKIMSHHYCADEHLDAAGTCRSVGLVRPTQKGQVSGRDITHVRRWFFGFAPIIEPFKLEL